MKNIILIGSIFLCLLSGCQKEEPELETTKVIIESTSEPETTLSDEIRYEVLDGKTIEEYKRDYIAAEAYTPLEFDGETIKKELESITNKEDLKEFVYEKALTKEFIFDGENEVPLTHEETVNILICHTGYVPLPTELYENYETIDLIYEERHKLRTTENGFITIEDWDSMTLEEAKEHVYKLLKNEVDTKNQELQKAYEHFTSDEYIDDHINSRINAEQEALELEKSLQEEVDAIYESQMQKLREP